MITSCQIIKIYLCFGVLLFRIVVSLCTLEAYIAIFTFSKQFLNESVDFLQPFIAS